MEVGLLDRPGFGQSAHEVPRVVAVEFGNPSSSVDVPDQVSFSSKKENLYALDCNLESLFVVSFE
jgi:hypothetical protein